MNTSARNGKMAALMLVTDEDDLMIITREGMIIRQAVKDVKITQSRNTQGVRLINLTKGDQVCDITCVPPENEDVDNLEKKVEELKKVPPRSQPPVPQEIDEDFQDEEDDLDIDSAEDADDTEE
jgi:DNA gyrase subunit A